MRSAKSSLVQLLVATLSLFVLYRLLLDILGPREFGIWSLVMATTSVVSLSNMGLTGSLVKHVADAHASGDIRRLIRLVDTTVISVGLLALVIAAIAFPLMKIYLGATLPADAYGTAVRILPMGLAAFGLSMVAGIYQSALYGYQLIVQRNAILILESVSFPVLSLLLVGRYGLYGLVYARAAQNLITLVVSMQVLRRHLPLLGPFPRHWDRTVLRDMMGYALGFQLVGLLTLVMDPLTKGMLTRFGSLERVTYFEMGTRLVGQVRALIVNANQVLVPTFARAGNESSRVETLFLRSYEVVFYVTVCLFGLLIAALPLISILWLGARIPAFIAISTALSAGWLINTLSVPAYFASLGTGAIGTVVTSHVVMALLNVVLGYSFGRLWGGDGVVAAWVIALAAAGLCMHIHFSLRSGRGLKALVPSRGYRLIGFCGLGLVIGHAAQNWLGPSAGIATHAAAGKAWADGLVAPAAALLGFIAVFLAPALRNPVRVDLGRWLLNRRSA